MIIDLEDLKNRLNHFNKCYPGTALTKQMIFNFLATKYDRVFDVPDIAYAVHVGTSISDICKKLEEIACQ